MFIGEVCKAVSLTRKAVEYYEKQGLLHPGALENGYRSYEKVDVERLKEIAVLRKMGIGIADIRVLLSGADKAAVLAACKNRMAQQIALLRSQQGCIDVLLGNGYDIDETTKYVQQHCNEGEVLRKKLREAFPGNYGLFLAFHFGRFLSEAIDSPEKEAAYGEILAFLDGLADIPFPKEVEALLEENAGLWDESTAQAIEAGGAAATKAVAEDYDAFMKEKRKVIESYLEYCQTEAYKASPGYRMKQLMLNFQKESGYQEVFVKNMKILSSAYADYWEKLTKSNERFLQEYPEAAAILGAI